MKKQILNIAAIIMLLFVATAVSAAGTVTFVKTLDGEVNTGTELGTISAVTETGDGLYTFSITPAADYFIGDVTAVKLINAGLAQSRKNEPGINPSVEIWAGDDTNWFFRLEPGEADIYDVEVTVNFYSKTDISGAIVTLADVPDEGFDYSGEAYTPEVASVMLDGEEIGNDFYELSYSGNINAGTATVTVTGKDIYKGSATATFTINKAALSNLRVSINGWTYGTYSADKNSPSVTDNTGNGTVTYTYADATAAEPTFSEIVPTNAGSYIVKASVAETGNYAAGEATTTFNIAKADITPSVDLLGWVYGNTPNTPTVTGNTGNGEVTYKYAVDNASPEYTGTMPSVVGDYIVMATFAETSNYNGAEATDTFLISKANLADVVIADIPDQTYEDGEPIEPAITVTYNGIELDESEYHAEYSNNENVGMATVTLTTLDKNFAEGETAPSKTFKIVPAVVEITAENQIVTYNGDIQEFDNYESDVEVEAFYYASEEERAKEDGEWLEVVMNAGTYYVKLVPGEDNYTFAPVYVTFTIEPKTITEDMLWTEGDGEVYDGTPKTLMEYGLRDWISDEEVELEEGNEDADNDFTVAYTNNINVGTATATFTGHGNYTGSFTTTFDIVRDLMLTFNESRQWATYYAEEDLQIPEGIEAYIVTDVDGSEVIVSGIDYIPQHVAVLLNYAGNIEEAPGEFYAYAYDAAEPFDDSDNLLEGTSTGIDVTNIATGTVYVLYNDEFVKTISGNIPAGRGYLVVATSAVPGPEARTLTINIDENTTGIAEAAVAAKADGKYYNLQGQRMAQPKKGLNIVNGKIIVVK